jgi:hypothetical protein
MEHRFAREFLAELIREPRALKEALLADRAKWLRSLRITGREDLLFEFEMLLRAIELAFGRRYVSATGRGVLGHDFAEDTRALRDALHRSATLARRLLLPAAEQNFQFRAYVERHLSEDKRRPRLAQELSEQRAPDEALFVLRQQLRALQGMADQLVRQSPVTFGAFDDLAVLGEYILDSSRYFRPPDALEFRTEYDRVGSVRLLDLVKRLSDARSRKALALGFLACFRLLRYLRFIPAPSAPLQGRSMLLLLLVRDESVNVANYLTSDLRRLTASAVEARLIASSADEASRHLREAVAGIPVGISDAPLDRTVLEAAREALSEGAKAAAAALTQAAEPNAVAGEIFDGQRARRERAERLRKDLWLCQQLLRDSMEVLLPAMRGEPTQAFDRLAALQRFIRDFRQVGYYLLRPGDHEPYDRFFEAIEALMHTSPSPARDRHLYLECRRFTGVADRAFALVSRRAELLDVPFDPRSAEEELARYRTTAALLDPSADAQLVDAVMAGTMEQVAESIAAGGEETDSTLEMLGEPLDEPSLAPPSEERERTPEHSGQNTDPQQQEPLEGDQPFEPEVTRRIFR